MIVLKALSIKNPYAFDILTGEKQIEYRTWLPGTVHEFLLVSSGTPSATDFGLGIANGYAMGIVTITNVSDHPNRDGNYGWHVQPTMPIIPFPVKGKLHFYDVPDHLIHQRPDLIPSMQAYQTDETNPAAHPFTQAVITPLIEIGITQMPKKYQRLLDETGDWMAVATAWTHH